MGGVWGGGVNKMICSTLCSSENLRSSSVQSSDTLSNIVGKSSSSKLFYHSSNAAATCLFCVCDLCYLTTPPCRKIRTSGSIDMHVITKKKNSKDLPLSSSSSHPLPHARPPCFRLSKEALQFICPIVVL